MTFLLRQFDNLNYLIFPMILLFLIVFDLVDDSVSFSFSRSFLTASSLSLCNCKATIHALTASTQEL